MAGKRWTEEEIAECIRLSRLGFTQTEIGKVIGRAQNSISKMLIARSVIGVSDPPIRARDVQYGGMFEDVKTTKVATVFATPVSAPPLGRDVLA